MMYVQNPFRRQKLSQWLCELGKTKNFGYGKRDTVHAELVNIDAWVTRNNLRLKASLGKRLCCAHNRNRKLDISTAPRKARSREPAYSQAVIQNKIDRQRVRSIELGRETVRRLWWMV